jgi:hypothetical protein
VGLADGFIGDTARTPSFFDMILERIPLGWNDPLTPRHFAIAFEIPLADAADWSRSRTTRVSDGVGIGAARLQPTSFRR